MPDIVPSITFIFIPLAIQTSPPFMPGLHGTIHVIVIFISGVLLPFVYITIVILELKSPVSWARDVLSWPPNVQVDVLVHEPSILWATWLDLQFFWRNCELK